MRTKLLVSFKKKSYLLCTGLFFFFFFNVEVVVISPEYHFSGSYNVSMMQRCALFLLHFPGAKWLKRGADDLPSPSFEIKIAWNFISHCHTAPWHST